MSAEATSSLILTPEAHAREEARPKPEILHRKKFMDGKMTPKEVHRAFGLGRPCSNCGGPPAIRIRVFMPLDEATQRAPNFVAAVAAISPLGGGKLPTVKFKEHAGDTVGKDYIKASDTCWCDNCKVEARITAAKNSPSWAVVQIDEGHKDIVQVGFGS
jgi:hypothetical protein